MSSTSFDPLLFATLAWAAKLYDDEKEKEKSRTAMMSWNTWFSFTHKQEKCNNFFHSQLPTKGRRCSFTFLSCCAQATTVRGPDIIRTVKVEWRHYGNIISLGFRARKVKKDTTKHARGEDVFSHIQLVVVVSHTHLLKLSSFCYRVTVARQLITDPFRELLHPGRAESMNLKIWYGYEIQTITLPNS